MKQKVSDYIVTFLINQGISDVFGYPGGMVTHLMESFSRRGEKIKAHVTYHEQGAAFAACGYAQTSGKPGVAYATSGPGATNLVTGICHAYFDSIPTIFITGQVNTFESKGEKGIRQCGFQETDIVSMVRNVTKYSVYIGNAKEIRYHLERALFEAMDGRKGPVLLDIPMDIQRAIVETDELQGFNPPAKNKERDMGPCKAAIEEALTISKRPCLILGNGIKSAQKVETVQAIINCMKIPVLTSMIAFDIVGGSPYGYGFIGAYGHRSANFILAKSDLIITVGTRLDVRQVGAKRENFALNAKIIRMDIDEAELGYPVHQDEQGFMLSVKSALAILGNLRLEDYSGWIQTCDEIKNSLDGIDNDVPQEYIQKLSTCLPHDAVITTDVGQNQVWVAQALKIKQNQRVLFSGGHGAMGYSLPAAIGACYGARGKRVICLCGDGGFQMNIQELQFILRENLPITIILLNNDSLGMIRHFQEMYFDSNFYQTKAEGGYTTPDFNSIIQAYGIQAKDIKMLDQLENINWNHKGPLFIHIHLSDTTYVFPKLEFGKPNQDQEPLIDRDLYKRLMGL